MRHVASIPSLKTKSFPERGTIDKKKVLLLNQTKLEFTLYKQGQISPDKRIKNQAIIRQFEAQNLDKDICELDVLCLSCQGMIKSSMIENHLKECENAASVDLDSEFQIDPEIEQNELRLQKVRNSFQNLLKYYQTETTKFLHLLTIKGLQANDYGKCRQIYDKLSELKIQQDAMTDFIYLNSEKLTLLINEQIQALFHQSIESLDYQDYQQASQNKNMESSSFQDQQQALFQINNESFSSIGQQQALVHQYMESLNSQDQQYDILNTYSFDKMQRKQMQINVPPHYVHKQILEDEVQLQRNKIRKYENKVVCIPETVDVNSNIDQATHSYCSPTTNQQSNSSHSQQELELEESFMIIPTQNKKEGTDYQFLCIPEKMDANSNVTLVTHSDCSPKINYQSLNDYSQQIEFEESFVSIATQNNKEGTGQVLCISETVEVNSNLASVTHSDRPSIKYHSKSDHQQQLELEESVAPIATQDQKEESENAAQCNPEIVNANLIIASVKYSDCSPITNDQSKYSHSQQLEIEQVTPIVTQNSQEEISNKVLCIPDTVEVNSKVPSVTQQQEPEEQFKSIATQNNKEETGNKVLYVPETVEVNSNIVSVTQSNFSPTTNYESDYTHSQQLQLEQSQTSIATYENYEDTSYKIDSQNGKRNFYSICLNSTMYLPNDHPGQRVDVSELYDAAIRDQIEVQD